MAGLMLGLAICANNRTARPKSHCLRNEPTQAQGMTAFGQVHVLFALGNRAKFFDEELRIDWRRAKFGIEFTPFRLKIEFDAEKTCGSKCFTVRGFGFHIASEGAFAVIDAKHGLKAFGLTNRRFWLFTVFDRRENAVIITPIRRPPANTATPFDIRKQVLEPISQLFGDRALFPVASIWGPK
jgi:hypothetical protein